MWCRIALATLGIACSPVLVAAQAVGEARRGVVAAHADTINGGGEIAVHGLRVSRDLAPLASALVPGLGQAMLGQGRMVAYLGAELYFWGQYLKERAEFRRQRDTYRGLARNVARFSLSADGPDGDWRYYEAVGNHRASGAFSLAPAGETVPETDTSTFNGKLWFSSQRLYGLDPSAAGSARDPARVRSALNYYVAHAIPRNLEWSWQNALLEQDLYKRAIDQANESFRHATVARGVIIANHLLSAIDAFTAVRLSAPVGPDGATRFTVTLPLPGRR